MGYDLRATASRLDARQSLLAAKKSRRKKVEGFVRRVRPLGDERDDRDAHLGLIAARARVETYYANERHKCHKRHRSSWKLTFDLSEMPKNSLVFRPR
jgi:hypothetical protein